MTITESTPPRIPDPTSPQRGRPPEPERPARSSSTLAWAQLALCTASVICGVIIGLACSIELGSTLAGAGLDGASIRIDINVRR